VESIEEALQNQYGSDLIHDLTVAGEGQAGSMEMAVCFRGGEALVPEVDREGKCGAKTFREGLGFDGLWAEVAGHVDRIADDDAGAVELVQKAPERFEVVPGVFADEGKDGLSGETELVGDGDADAAISEIEAQKARFHSIMLARWGSVRRRERPHLTMS
jgi:hypothetical protein